MSLTILEIDKLVKQLEGSKDESIINLRAKLSADKLSKSKTYITELSRLSTKLQTVLKQIDNNLQVVTGQCIDCLTSPSVSFILKTIEDLVNPPQDVVEEVVEKEIVKELEPAVVEEIVEPELI